MRVRSIRIEGMHNVISKSYKLQNLTYFHGKNGVGKSTVLQAIQLAVLGYIPGMNKTASGIFKHSNNHTMAVTVSLGDDSDEVTIRRVWNQSGKSVKTTVTVVPEGYDISTLFRDIELPVFNFGEFTNMSSNQLKDWFISFLPDNVTEVDWTSALKDSASSFVMIDDQLVPRSVKDIAEVSKGKSSVEGVKAANAYFKSQQSFLKQELERVQSTISSLIYYDECDEFGDVEEVQEHLQKCNDQLVNITQQLSAYDNNFRLQSTIDTYHLEASCFEKDPIVSKTKDQISTVDEAISRTSKLLEDCRSKLQQIEIKKAELRSLANSNGICPYTDEKCESVSKKSEEAKEAIAKLETYQAEVKDNFNSYKADVDSLRQQKSTIESVYMQTKDKYDRVAQLQNQFDLRYGTNFSVEARRVLENTIASLKSDIANYQDQLMKLGANQKYESFIKKLTREKARIEQNLEILKVWVKLTGPNGLPSQLMKAPFEEFEAQITENLTNLFNREVTASFMISSEANSFSFGMRTESGEYIPFDLLSSGEKCLYATALMLSIVYNNVSPFRVIIIDDLLDHLDDSNIETFFNAVKDLDVQFILAGVKDPTDNIKEDVINL